jgi:ribosomal protein L14E/L6E/L27E
MVVFSKKGRDKGLPFIIIDVNGDYAYLADGLVRTLDKPKKKKLKHTQPTLMVVNMTDVGGRGLQDADIRKWLLPYKVRKQGI